MQQPVAKLKYFYFRIWQVFASVFGNNIVFTL